MSIRATKLPSPAGPTYAMGLPSPLASTHLSELKSHARNWLDMGIGDDAEAVAEPSTVLAANNVKAGARTFAHVNTDIRSILPVFQANSSRRSHNRGVIL